MIWALIKINITAMLAGVFRRYGKKKRITPVMAILIGLLVVYIGGAFMLTVGAVFYGICEPLFCENIGWFYFALAGILIFALCFIGSVFMVQSQIFGAKDNEFLLAMPIKPSAILSGRLASLILIEYIYAAIVFVPSFVVLIITGFITSIPVLGIVFYFIAAALIPLLSLAVGCLVGWGVTLISSRMRHKSILTIIISLIFLGIYFWFQARLMSNMSDLIVNGAGIADAVRSSVFPAYHMGVAIADGNILSLLLFAVCAIVPFALMCALLSKTFMKLVAGVRSPKKIAYREKALRVSGVSGALLRRELRSFFTQPLYVINSALGAIVTAVLAVVLIVYPKLLTDQLVSIAAFIPSVDIGLVGAVVLSALAVMNSISAPSVSLEGKFLWILKSMPVLPRDVLLSKAGLHFVVAGLPALFAGVVCVFAVPVGGFLPILLTILTPLSLTLMLSLLGVALNLVFPRFDWINPIQPVKQGASVMIAIFGGMALIAVLIIVFVMLGGAIALEVYLLLCNAVFIAASAALFMHLIGAGSRKFEELPR